MTRMSVAVVLAVAVVAAGCGDDIADSPDCSTYFAWGGERYVALGSAGPEVAGVRLGHGDYFGCPSEPPDRVTVFQLRGVAPSVAVGVGFAEEPREVSLMGRRGFIAESPRHPLHRTIYRSDSKPNQRVDYDCGPPRTVPARVTLASPFETGLLKLAPTRSRDRDFLEGDGSLSYVLLDASTRFVSAELDGLPFVRSGQLATLVLRGCWDRVPLPGETDREKLLVADEFRGS